MKRDKTDDAIHPTRVNSISAKALMGEKPPISIPQSSRGMAGSANVDRLAIVGEMTDNRLLRINGISACHREAPLPNKKSYCARLC